MFVCEIEKEKGEIKTNFRFLEEYSSKERIETSTTEKKIFEKQIDEIRQKKWRENSFL